MKIIFIKSISANCFALKFCLMDPDYDVTFDSDAGPSSREAKSHFLDSLGFDEGSFLAEAVGSRDVPSGEDEGVVLSSQPDEIGYASTIAEPARNPSFSFPVDRWGTEPDASAVSLPNEAFRPEPGASPEAIEGADAIDGLVRTADLKDQTEEECLHLHCPGCRGALVLERRHLGVEGTCVWCHIPIVAAASGQDGSVRIFPIGDVKSEPAPSSPISEAAVPPEPETMTGLSEEKPSEPASGNSFPSEPASVVNPPTPPAEPRPQMESGFVAPPDPLDLDGLYQADGFVPPPEEAPLSAPEPVATPDPVAGFGSDTPSPWGPPSQPIAEPPQAFVDVPSSLPPLQAAVEELPTGSAISDPAPAELSWESAFGNADFGNADARPEPPSPSFFSAMPTIESMEAAPAGFSPAFKTGSAPDRDTPSSNFSFNSLPATSLHEAPTAADRGSVSFDALADGEPFDHAPRGGDEGFGNPIFAHSASLPWGPPITDAAPETLPPTEEKEAAVSDRQPVFPANPFGSSGLLGPGEPSSSAASPFSSFSPIAEADPPEPAATGAGASEPAAEAPAPTVVSQPLGSKPKPKVRKGFLALVVVIVGFACGAALATFVLPVDRYVAATRSFLEAKLAPAPAMPLAPVSPGSPENGATP